MLSTTSQKHHRVSDLSSQQRVGSQPGKAEAAEAVFVVTAHPLSLTLIFFFALTLGADQPEGDIHEFPVLWSIL